jgi:hypothetical protein
MPLQKQCVIRTAHDGLLRLLSSSSYLYLTIRVPIQEDHIYLNSGEFLGTETQGPGHGNEPSGSLKYSQFAD